MSEELKPCPFCAGDASEYWPNSTTKHYVQCNKCGARTALYLASHGGSAKDDWNSRTSNTLIEEQAARIEELEQKLRTTSLEALAISDTNNEMAVRIAEAEKDYHEERKARYAAQSELVVSQARLSEAVKVLERIMAIVTYPCDTSIQARGYGVRSIDVSGCEYIAEAIDAFITTLGGEK